MSHRSSSDAFRALVAVVAASPFLVSALAQESPTPDAACHILVGKKLSDGEVVSAQRVMTGTLSLPAAPPNPAREFTELPPFCRVAAKLRPTSKSDINVEVWLPLAEWNGKLMGVGNGGWSGSINYGQMLPGLRRGYAVTSTDTGHQSSVTDASWALGHRDKQIDFGYRAVHEMTVAAKKIVSTFYGVKPRYSYWLGCSSGGRQGLKEAQRYPADYDGIVAGAPANNWTHQMSQIISIAKVVRVDPNSQIPSSTLPLIHDEVLRQCDGLDGVKDGLLEDPRRCPFDPISLQCSGAASNACLTPTQAGALKQIYAPTRNSKGMEIFPGLAKGGERGWGNVPQPFAIADNHFKFVVFNDLNWDFKTLDLDRDVPKADRIDSDVGRINAIDPNLSAFSRRGGKIIQFHGWNDQQIAPQSSIDYYESVVARVRNRDAVEDFYRLFMVPGMMHCQGGDGATDQFDRIGALEQWVERGVAPESMVASHVKSGNVVRTRPLCPYPKIAKWTGAGNTDEAANFACATQ